MAIGLADREPLVEGPGEGGEAECLVFSTGRGDFAKSRAQTRQVASCIQIHTEAPSTTRAVQYGCRIAK